MTRCTRGPGVVLLAVVFLLAGAAGLCCVAWWRSLGAYEAVQVRLSPGSHGPGVDVAWSRGVVDVWVGMRSTGQAYVDAVRFALPAVMPQGGGFHISAAGGEARAAVPLWFPAALAAGGAAGLLWWWLRGRRNVTGSREISS